MVLSIMEHYRYLQFDSALSYIMFTLCYYAIDSQRVNCTLRQTFIIFPMLLHKRAFPISPAHVSVHGMRMHLLITNNVIANNSILVTYDKAETLPVILMNSEMATISQVMSFHRPPHKIPRILQTL